MKQPDIDALVAQTLAKVEAGADFQHVVSELVRTKGNLVTALVIDAISKAQGGQGEPQLIAQAKSIDALGRMIERVQDIETPRKLDPTLN